MWLLSNLYFHLPSEIVGTKRLVAVILNVLMHFYLTKQYYLILLLKKIKLKNNDVQAYSKGCFAQHTVILMMMLISAMFHK